MAGCGDSVILFHMKELPGRNIYSKLNRSVTGKCHVNQKVFEIFRTRSTITSSKSWCCGSRTAARLSVLIR